jgi:hypothetical protein
MRDASIAKRTRAGIPTHDDEFSCEVVTPILTYEDMADLQEIVRKLRAAGAFANKSCGIHVHVGAGDLTVRHLWNLQNMVAAKEDLLVSALGINHDRLADYCKRTDEEFLKELNEKKPVTRQQLAILWYGGCPTSRMHSHYDSSRYHMLNLHAVFSKGTVEFRMFNGSTHAGKIKAYVQLCLAMVQHAKATKRAKFEKLATENPKYTFRCWLLRLGLIGDEFKTARKHLLDKLEGDTAWRNGRGAA